MPTLRSALTAGSSFCAFAPPPPPAVQGSRHGRLRQPPARRRLFQTAPGCAEHAGRESCAAGRVAFKAPAAWLSGGRGGRSCAAHLKHQARCLRRAPSGPARRPALGVASLPPARRRGEKRPLFYAPPPPSVAPAIAPARPPAARSAAPRPPQKRRQPPRIPAAPSRPAPRGSARPGPRRPTPRVSRGAPRRRSSAGPAARCAAAPADSPRSWVSCRRCGRRTA